MSGSTRAEPHLARQFGGIYERYRATVPRWLGRPLALVFLGAVGSSGGCGALIDGGHQTRSDIVVRLDHVPIAVRSLEEAVGTYREGLGFSIKPGRPHPNSIRNAHIKFADGSALELITATGPGDELAARYLRLLADREGGAFLALDAGRVEPLMQALRPTALPLDTAVASWYESLSFRSPSPLDYLFFIRIHHRPPDLPEHLSHPNTARGLHAVWISRNDHAAEERLFEALGVVPRAAAVSLPGGGSVQEIVLGSGRLYFVDSETGMPQRPVMGATIEVADLDRALATLGPEAGESVLVGADTRGRFARLPPRTAHGMWLEFLQKTCAFVDCREGV